MNGNHNALPVRRHANARVMESSSRGSCFFSPLYRRAFLLISSFLIAISLGNAFMTQYACAATWPVSISGLSASVAFKQTYTAGDTSYAHSGIDIPASAGTQIASPLAGTVRFTGAIPSGDSRIGGSSPERTMDAVSIEVEGGKVITLMPFSSIDVAEGQVVAEGARLGTLAPSGDISSAGVHLHMGYKRGRTYLDPMQLFEAGSRGQEGAEPQPEGAGAASASMPAPSAFLDPAPAANPAVAPEASASPAGDLAVESFGSIETGAYSWHPHAEGGFSLAELLGGLFEPVLFACYGQLTALVDALSSLSRGTGIPLPVLLATMLALALCACAVLVLLVLRLAVPYVRNMWEIRKTRLSMHAGGDSMHKLFPAPGAAFMSRGRIARGR